MNQLYGKKEVIAIFLFKNIQNLVNITILIKIKIKNGCRFDTTKFIKGAIQMKKSIKNNVSILLVIMILLSALYPVGIYADNETAGEQT